MDGPPPHPQHGTLFRLALSFKGGEPVKQCTTRSTGQGTASALAVQVAGWATCCQAGSSLAGRPGGWSAC